MNRFQHALAMLAGIVTPPLILGGSAGANLDQATQQYLISASLIVCGILSSVQITRFHLFKTPYYIGTGLIRYRVRQLSLILVWWEHHLQPFLWRLELFRSGMPMGLAQSTLAVHAFRVPRDTEQFLEQRVSARSSKLH
jgi:Permease family